MYINRIMLYINNSGQYMLSKTWQYDGAFIYNGYANDVIYVNARHDKVGHPKQ